MENTKTTLSGFHSSLQTIRLILTPLVMATPPVIIWHYLYINGWHSTSQADEAKIYLILQIISTAHIFLAGFMISREMDDIRKLKHAVKEVDKLTFIEIAEDTIPAPMKYILFTTANLILGWTISLHYEVYWTGFASVYSVGYILSLIWEIIVDFDDPVNGIWVIKGVLPEWIKEARIKRRISDRLFDWIFKKTAAS